MTDTEVVAYATLALAVATAALAFVAFFQLRQSKFATIEATKTRADSRGPRATVVAMRPFWPPCQPAQYLDGDDQPWPLAHEFNLPKDGNLRIRMKGLGYIINDGDTVTAEIPDEIRFNPSVPVGFEGIEETGQAEYLAGRRYVVPARTIVRFEYLVTGTVVEWVEAHERGKKWNASITLVVGDQLATGIEDTFTIDVLAYPLLPKADYQGVWLVPLAHMEGAARDHVEVRPAVRHYRDGSS
jgi:hypothetical protein